jgi:hypothetical protein
MQKGAHRVPGTRKNRGIERIKGIVVDTLKRDAGNVRIVDVFVTSDVDGDGDRVLVIKVVFEGKPKERDFHSMSGVVRHLRPKLAEMGEMAFPLISFISKADAGAARLGIG